MRTALLLIVLVAGCNSEPPPPATYTATGTVTLKGGKPFRGGLITLTSQSDPSKTLDAVIGDDGTFKLASMHLGRRIEGVPDGSYTVMVSSKFDAASGGVGIYVLPQPVVIEPRDTNLAIEVNPATMKR